MFASSAAWRRISRVLLPALALAFALLGQPALADSNPPNCGLPPNDQIAYCTEQVNWHNASIQHDPIVYLVFWGSEWEDTTNSDYTQAIAETNSLFDSLAGTAYNNILTQYYDSSGSVHNDVARGGWWIDDQDPIPSSLDTFGQFINVIARAAASNGWRVDADAQYLIYPQQHTSSIFGTFSCGGHFQVPVTLSDGVQHQVAASYELYPTDFNCSYGTVADSLVITSAHEYAEAVTDPNGPLIPPASWGWSTNDPNGPSMGFDPIEVADKCQGYNNGAFQEKYIVKSDGTHLNIPPLWDRTQGTNGCVTTHGQDYDSPDNTFPFHGVHTVEDAINTEYQNQSGLGAPLTEQMPINGGQVSYFVGSSCGSTSGYVIPSNTSYGGSGLTSWGAIYDSSATGAHEVDGCNFYKYWHDRGGPAGTQGFPTSDVLVIPNGFVSYFAGNPCVTSAPPTGPYNSNSAIYTSGWGTYFVGGCIYQKYVTSPLNGPGGVLGFPTSDVQAISGGYVAHFANNVCVSADATNGGSAIYYGNNVGAAYEVQGCIYYKYWHDLGGPAGPLGFPTSDECGVGDRRSSFQHGTITWVHATGQLLVQYSSNPPPVCGGTSPAMIALTSGNTFVAIGNTLYKYDLGTSGTTMLSPSTSGTTGPDYIGNQSYSSAITAIAANEQYLFVALANHRVVKTTLCGTGNNMCALSDGIGSGSLGGYTYWIGYQDYSVPVTGLAATPSTLYTNLAGGGIQRTVKTTLCGTGGNMCALSDSVGTNSLSGYSYWVGRQDWAWAPTAIAANDSLVLTTIGSDRVCKTTPGSSGANVFALSDGTCTGNYPGYHYWIGYQDWSTAVTNLAIDNSHIWWGLGSQGRLVQTTWCGTGGNICALSDGLGTQSLGGYSYWVGYQDWCAGYNQMGVASNNQFVDALFITGTVTRVVKANAGSGMDMFAPSDCTGTDSAAGYNHWIGSQDFTVS